MDPAVRRLIEALHQASFRCVVAVTGGGTRAAAHLLGVPGASRTVLEVLVPYDDRSLTEFLGRRPEQSCSAETSRMMAGRARERARWLVPGENVVGVGCTASLATDRPKKGDHRFHITVETATAATTRSLTLTKGARAREGEEVVLDAVLLNALGEVAGVEDRVAVPLLPGEDVHLEQNPLTDSLRDFFRGERQAVCVEPDGRVNGEARPPAVLLPGSFNPAHAGHWGLAAAAARIVGGPAAFELSVVNVDKPELSPEEVRRRLAQFAWRAPLWLTRAPTFARKAELLPGVVFAVGADTAERIVQPRYYGDSEERMRTSLAIVRDRGCRFLAAGRRSADGRFLTLADLQVPPACRDLFAGVPESEFHADVSSTLLRGSERTDAPG
jgi:hypothetical protein